MSVPTYLDHAATSPIRPEVAEAMLPYLGPRFGNPSSSHAAGREARAGLERARREVAEAVGCPPSQVLFTSGGTEADNLAVIGAALAARTAGRPMRVAVSAIEHKAVLAAAHFVETLGGEARILPVDRRGVLELPALDEALAGRPAIVSVMWVNNEVGTIQPLAEIAARCRAAEVRFHSDAVQAFGKLPLDAKALPGALLTISGHKIGAPKGIGALILPERNAVLPLQHGGGQQQSLRPGTENVAGAVALGVAARLAVAEREAAVAHTRALREAMEARLTALVPDLVVHAAEAERAPHVLNASVPGVESGVLLMHLDLAGICASGGSACSTGAVEPSHVLTAMGVPHALAAGAIRLSVGRETTMDDIDRLVAAFPEAVARARQLAESLGGA